MTYDHKYKVFYFEVKDLNREVLSKLRLKSLNIGSTLL